MIKLFKNFSYSSIAMVVVQVLQLLVISITARNLNEEDFGVFTLSMLIMNFSLLLAECGSGSFLICSKKFDKNTMSTCLIVNFVISLLIYLFLFCGLYIWGVINPDFNISSILILSISLIFLSCSQVPKASLEYSGKFNVIAICDMLSSIIAFIFSIGIYWLGYICSLYTLIIFSLFSSIIKTIFYFYVDNDKKYIFYIDKKIIKEIKNFSIHLVANNLLVFFSRNNDQLVVGKMIGITALGNYSLAMKFSLQPILRFTSIIQRVIMPDLSKYNNTKEFNYIVSDIFNILILIMIPLSVFIYYISDFLVAIFLGSKWNSVSIIIQSSCLLPLVYSIIQLIQNVILVKKNTKLLFLIQIFSVITSLILIFLTCLLFGINYVAIAMTLSMILVFLVSYLLAIKKYAINIIVKKEVCIISIFSLLFLYFIEFFLKAFSIDFIISNIIFIFSFLSLISYILYIKYKGQL